MHFGFNFSYSPVILPDKMAKKPRVCINVWHKFQNVLWLKITIIKKTLCFIQPWPSTYSSFTSNWYSAMKPNLSSSLHYAAGLLSFHLPRSNLLSLSYDAIWPSSLECKYVWRKSLKLATRSTHFTLKPLVNRSSIWYADILFILFIIFDIFSFFLIYFLKFKIIAPRCSA